MKKLYSIFLLLFLINFCFGQEEQLPEFPWKDIVEMQVTDTRNLRKWNSDINVELIGGYTKLDSLKVVDILERLDDITETVSISISKSGKSNYKIFFSDFFSYDKISYNIDFDVDRSADDVSPLIGRCISALDLIIYKKDKFKNNEYIYNLLEVFIARTLVSTYFTDDFSKNYIIFRSNYYNLSEDFRLTGKYLESYNRELEIIREVYKKNFYKKLQIAKKNYEKDAKKELKNKVILNRERGLWWVENPYAVMVLPAILLACFFLYLFFKIKPSIYKITKKEWIRLIILILVALVFVDFLIIINVSTYDYLTIPQLNENNRFIKNDTILTTLVFSLFSIPFILIFRYIELKIQEKSSALVSKIILIFISTGFLPSLLACCIYLIKKQYDKNSTHFLTWETYYFKNQQDYILVSKIFLVFMILAILRTLISYFLLNEKEIIKENELKLANLKALKAKAELKSLQSHINPHFLYNALNSIASLVHTSPDKSEKMVLSLSNLFRYSINKKGKQMSTIAEEVVMVKNYLAIESERFGERLQVSINVAKEIEKEEIPMFILQPLVENAIKHGVSKIRTRGEIVLKIEKEKNTIVISVYDNGPDFPEGLVSGYGLQMVYDLLRLSYGDKASVSWQNNPEKSIQIQLPIILKH